MADQLDSVFGMVKQQLESERAKMVKEFDEKEAELRKALDTERDRMHSEWSWVMNVSGSKGEAEVPDKMDVGHAASVPTVDRVITLDVGGKRFKTTRDTLTKVPGSMLDAMFGGRHPVHPEKDGSFFIDNDGTDFEEILNYLRHGTVYLRDDRVRKRKLASEALFYGLDGLHHMLNPPLSVVSLTALGTAKHEQPNKYIRMFTWGLKHASEFVKIGSNKECIELTADGDFDVKLEVNLITGYASGQASGPNAPSLLILLEGTPIGERRLKGDESINQNTGTHDPELVVLDCKISQGRAGQAVTVKFSTGAIHQTYANQQAQGTSISAGVKQLSINKLLM